MNTMQTPTPTPPDTPPLVQAARDLLGDGVAVEQTAPGAPDNGLYPDELASVGPMVPLRRREFAAGRRAARRAMASFGIEPDAIPMGDDRAPIWPGGVIGTITHDSTICLAAIAREGTCAGLGLDIENDTGLDRTYFNTLLTEDEKDRVAHLPVLQQAFEAKLIFSAKECAYKAQFRQSRVIFDFQTLEIEFVPDTDRFIATYQRSIAPFEKGDRLEGRYRRLDGWVMTAMRLPI